MIITYDGVTIKVSQAQMIYNHMLNHGSITSWEAIELFGCTRLPARISDLRKMGIPIIGTLETGKNRFGHICNYTRYTLDRRN